MSGIRSNALSTEQRAALAESFAATLAEPERTEDEASRLAVPLASYKSLRGRWEARGRRWADEGPAAVRPAVARALEREESGGGGGEANGLRPAAGRAPKAPKPAPGAELVPLIVLAGNMITAGVTTLIGRAFLKLPAEDVAPYTRPDEEGNKRLAELAVPLAAYLDKRIGAAGEHAPVIAFGLAIGGGVWARASMMRDAKRAQSKSDPSSPSGAASSTSGADPTGEQDSPS